MRLTKLKQTVQRRKYWLIIIVLLGVIGVFAHTVSAPVKGHIIPIDVKLKHSNKVAPAHLPATSVQSSYYNLDLPAGYRVQDSSTSVPGLLYQQTLIKPSLGGSLIISIAVKAIPEGGLAGDSSYQGRVNQGNRYQMRSQSISGDTLTVANDTQSASIVAFWPHGAYLATIGISSGLDNPATNDNIDEITILQPLLKDWQWQH